MSGSSRRRFKNAEFPSQPETPIMPEIHDDLRVVIPQLTISHNLLSKGPSTWQIVIGGRDFRLTCSHNLTRMRLWAYDGGLRWNLQMRMTWLDKFSLHPSKPGRLVHLHIVNAQGDAEEITNDLLTLRLAA